MASKVVALKEISDSIYHLEFPNDHLMCSSLVRFQEHYECPRFKDKVFTLEEYMDWYAAKFGNFTYFLDIAGFNIPSYALKKFYQGKFDPLTKKEKKILQIFKDIKEPYYIIATCKKSDNYDNDLIHEISHGLYYVNEEYHRDVRRILRGQDLSGVYAWLKKKGYHRKHFLDEAHAILLEDADSFNRCEQKAHDYREIRKQLRDNYDKHYVQLITKTKKIKMP